MLPTIVLLRTTLTRGDQTKRSTTWFNSAQFLTREQNVLITVCVNWIWLLFTKVDDDKHHPHEHNQVTRKTNFTNGSSQSQPKSFC